MSPKEMLEEAIFNIHTTKGVRYKDIVKTLKNIIKELEQIEE